MNQNTKTTISSVTMLTLFIFLAAGCDDKTTYVPRESLPEGFKDCIGAYTRFENIGRILLVRCPRDHVSIVMPGKTAKRIIVIDGKEYVEKNVEEKSKHETPGNIPDK